MKSHSVRFWELRPRKTANGDSWTVRWTVAGREKSVTLAKKAQAERHRARLMQAADRGEAFDTDTGLPDSMAREVSSLTWYEHACAFADVRWPKVAAKGRISLVEGLVAVTPVLVTSQRGAPGGELLRLALRRWAFNPPRRDAAKPADVEAALAWLARASLPLAALAEPGVLARALDACGQKLDGSAASAEYYRRRRRVLYAALKHAVRHGNLSANPLDTPDQEDWKPPAVAHAVDRRRVPNPAQMRDLLIAIGKVGRTQGPRLVALYGCMYYAMLRPSDLPRRHLSAVDSLAGAPGGTAAGIHSRPGGLAAGPQALRPPACRRLVAAQLGRAGAEGRRVGRAQRGDHLPGLCALPRRRGGPLV